MESKILHGALTSPVRLAAVALLAMVVAALPVQNKVALKPELYPLLLNNCNVPSTLAALERHKWKLAVRSLARMVRPTAATRT